jgi:photosystem II stability/assembly factor-like uncharacterized protein
LPEETGDENIALSWPNSGLTEQLVGLQSPDGEQVWVSGAKGTYSVSQDGGQTWLPDTVIAGAADALEFRDVEVRSQDLVYLLAAGPVGLSRIYRTLDGGQTWAELFRSDVDLSFYNCMTFVSDDHGFVYGDSIDGKLMILETTNGIDFAPIDASRLPAALPGEAGFSASGTCATSVDQLFVWMGTAGAEKGARVLRSTDAGFTWSAQETPILSSMPTQGITSVAFYDAFHGYAFGADVAAPSDSDKLVAYTDDGGLTWELRASTTNQGMNYGGATSSDGERVIAVGPKGVSYSLDGGMMWRQISAHNMWTVTFLDDNRAVAAGAKGKIVLLDFVD